MSTGDQYPKQNDNIWRGDHLTTPETGMLVGNHENQIHALDRRTSKLERLTDAMLVDWASWRIRTDKRIDDKEDKVKPEREHPHEPKPAPAKEAIGETMDYIPCDKCGCTHIWTSGDRWRCMQCDPPKSPAKDEPGIHEKLDRIGQDVTFCINDIRQVQEHLTMREINNPKIIAEHDVKLPPAPDTGERDEEAYTNMRTEEFLTRICKLEKLAEAMMKDRATDGLAWEQDILNANRRIKVLETQYPPLTTMEARIAALEEITNSPSLRGCKLWADCTALLQRTAALENAVASIKLGTPPPEVESVRCDCNQTAFVGHKDDPVVTLWQLYKVASDARTKIVLKLEDIEAKLDKFMEIKNEKEE